MPVNSLSITKRELRKFEGTAESGRVDITGEYEVIIKNEGLLPVRVSEYEIQKLSPTSVNKTFIEEKNSDVGRLSSGSTKTVNIPFKISGSKDQLMTLARTGCNGNTIQCKVKEQISGTILALPFDKKRDLSVSSGSCSLDSGTGRAPVEPAPTPPEPAPSEPVQNLTMRIDGPTEVTAGQENSWVIDGNNVNEVNQIRVELGDGSTTTTRREIQAQNPRQPQTTSSPELALSGVQQTGANDNTPSDVGQVFTHTYSSEGQYTIVAEAINSNGQTVGSARYDVTVNPQVTTDPVEPEPTNPANFNITVNSKNEPVNPGGQMVIDYTVENTGEASGTGNITLNIDGQRADSSRRTINAGSSTSGTLTGTAPQINSSSVIFRPQITAEGVESNTVSPSFEVKQPEDNSENQDGGTQQPDPANLNLNITGTTGPVSVDESVNVQYQLSNTGGEATEVNVRATVNANDDFTAGLDTVTVQPGQSLSKDIDIAPSSYDSPGVKILRLSAENATDTTNFNVKEESDPAQLGINVFGTNSPVKINEDLNIEYFVGNEGGQTTNANIDVTISSANGVQTQVVETVNPGQSVQDQLTVPSTAYGTPGEKTATLQVDGDSAQTNFTVQQENSGQQFGSVNEITNQLGGIDAAREIIRLHGERLREYDTNSNGEISEMEILEATVDFRDTGELTEDELRAVEYFSANNQYFPQDGEGEQQYLDNAESIHEYDRNGDGNIDGIETGDAAAAFTGNELTQDEMEAIEYIFTNNIKFPYSPEQQNTQSANFLPPSMDKAAEDKF